MLKHLTSSVILIFLQETFAFELKAVYRTTYNPIYFHSRYNRHKSPRLPDFFHYFTYYSEIFLYFPKPIADNAIMDNKLKTILNTRKACRGTSQRACYPAAQALYILRNRKMETVKETNKSTEDISYFNMVLQQKIKQIANNEKKEYGVIISEIQAILNDCVNCAHCLAGERSATLICTSSGSLLGRNQVGCQWKERTIEAGCFTHNN